MTSMIILEHIPNFMLAKLFLEWIYKMIICNLLSMRNSAIPKKKIRFKLGYCHYCYIRCKLVCFEH